MLNMYLLEKETAKNLHFPEQVLIPIICIKSENHMCKDPLYCDNIYKTCSSYGM